MTDQEAINNLLQIQKQFHKWSFTEAINVAVNALEERIKKEGEQDV